MNFSAIWTIARKELTDSSRDRRAIYALLFGTLAGPVLIGFMFNQIANQERAAHEIQVPVVGRAYAPILVNWLQQQPGVEVVDGPSDPEAAVRDRKSDFVVVIDKDFAEKFRDSRPAPVELYSDSTRQNARAKVRRIRGLLNRFSAQIAGMRLIARGISPSLASSLKLEDVEVSSAQQRAANIFNIIPMFLILAAFSSAMQISTDSTAGERERGSLEPLLLNPVPRWQVVAGKWLAAAFVAMLGMLLTLVILSKVLARLPLEDLGVRYHLGQSDMFLLILTVAPMAMMAPAIQMYLACFAKSFKEAQSYMGFLIFGVMIPGIVSTFYPITNRPWMHPIPILGQYAAAADILGGKMPSPVGIAIAALASLALVVLLLSLATKLLSSEKIIFGR
jgi:sodium transport system permease protein